MNTWQVGLIRVAKDPKIVGEALRVFLVLCASVEVGYFAPTPPAAITRILRRHPSNVRKALEILVEKGIIKKRYQSGKLIGFELVEGFGVGEESSLGEDETH